MSSRLPPPTQFCPPEITAAAGPLLQVTALLEGLRHQGAALGRLAASAPDPRVREALDVFLQRWEQAAWRLGGDAHSLGDTLRRAAEAYRGTEADLARRLQHANPDHEGRRR